MDYRFEDGSPGQRNTAAAADQELDALLLARAAQRMELIAAAVVEADRQCDALRLELKAQRKELYDLSEKWSAWETFLDKTKQSAPRASEQLAKILYYVSNKLEPDGEERKRY